MTALPATDDRAAVAPSTLGENLARSRAEWGGAGRVDAACSLAGLACAATRRTDVREWKRFNALLHRWSARAGEPGRPLARAPVTNDMTTE